VSCMGSAPGGFYRHPPLPPPPGSEDHDIVPRPGTAYSVSGGNTGLPANLRNSGHYPAEAQCAGCGEMIRCEQWLPVSADGDWYHTGRRPGDPR